MNQSIPRVAFLLQNVDSGGVERVVVNLLKQLVKYPISLDLVLFDKQGNFLYEVPPEVRIVELPDAKTAGRLRRVFPLVRYLRREKPDILVSHLVQFNVIAAITKVISGVPFHLVLVEHLGFASLENQLKNKANERVGLLKILRYLFYPKSDVIAAVSKGLAEDLEEYLKMSSGKVQVLYNPVVGQELMLKAHTPLNHPWFQPDQPPVFLAAGRLASQKGFPTLIEAFSLLRQKHSARLIILGEGAERQQLEAQISQLNLESDVSLPGFTHNPYAYMSRARAFVCSSRFEALPTVLIEALACGCPVISTDCPHGPNEILMAGRYGKLVPVGDAQAMADAMEQAIVNPIGSNHLKNRSQDFSVDKVISRYLKVMNLGYLVKDRFLQEPDAKQTASLKYAED